MKIKRLKSYRRIIDAYSKHFDLKTDPLEIFVDSTFANQALLNKRLNIQEQFDCTLSVPFKLVTSTCVIRECEQLGSVFQGALNILSNYRLLPCRHKFDPSKGAPWCVKKRIALVRRSKRANVIDKNVTFALASNDEALQARARLVFGMPVFYIAHNRINLEQFPPEVLEFIQTKAHNAPKVSQHEETSILRLEKQFGLTEAEPLKKRRRPQGPNPLSCRPSTRKKRIVTQKDSDSVKKRRRRKRVKNTWAFQQVLLRLKRELNIPV